MKRKKEDFLESINRGGLCTASDLVYVSCLLVFDFHGKIFNDSYLKKMLLSFPSPRNVFFASVMIIVEENT